MEQLSERSLESMANFDNESRAEEFIEFLLQKEGNRVFKVVPVIVKERGDIRYVVMEGA